MTDLDTIVGCDLCRRRLPVRYMDVKEAHGDHLYHCPWCMETVAAEEVSQAMHHLKKAIREEILTKITVGQARQWQAEPVAVVESSEPQPCCLSLPWDEFRQHQSFLSRMGRWVSRPK
jgi:hypothetical protein